LITKSISNKEIKSKFAVSVDKQKEIRNKSSKENNSLKRRPLVTSSSQRKIRLKIINHEANKNSSEEINLNSKKKGLKTSEELILEEMSKFKFKAKPCNKDLFQNKVSSNSVNETEDVKMCDANGIKEVVPIAEIDESANDNQEINLKPVIPRERKTLPNLNSSRPVSKDRFSCKENMLQKEKSSSDQEEKFVFKARPMPEFTLKEVKRSTCNLTIPNPPKLTTTKKSLDKKI
jgi:hypothetical protein